MQENCLESERKNTAGLQKGLVQEQESYQKHRYLPFLASAYLTLMASMFQLYAASVPATNLGLACLHASLGVRQVRSTNINVAAVAHSYGGVFFIEQDGSGWDYIPRSPSIRSY